MENLTKEDIEIIDSLEDITFNNEEAQSIKDKDIQELKDNLRKFKVNCISVIHNSLAESYCDIIYHNIIQILI